MRTGLGLAFETHLEEHIESTTFAALSGAVVDALLSAAGILDLRDSFENKSYDDMFKQIELRLHYDGFEIKNIDVSAVSRTELPKTALQSFKEKICRILFLENDQVTVKNYRVPHSQFALQVQALVLIG